MSYTNHPAADIFPLLRGPELDALAADIRANGLRTPVLLHADGRVLDGRNRLAACELASVAPRFETWDGDGSATALVISLNLIRRHLDDSARAIAAARAKPMFEAEAKERMLAGKVAYPTANGRQGSALDRHDRTAAGQAASLLNVAPRAVERASVLVERGTADLVAAVEAGTASVSAAAQVATLPKERQAEIVAVGPKEILRMAKEIRAERATERLHDRLEKIAEDSRNNLPLAAIESRASVVYADPPWRYEFSSDRMDDIESHYQTMAIDDIKAMDLSAITTDDAILFLWATSPMLKHGLDVIEAWGFTYRTCAVWDKQHMGMGYYFRQQHELLLVATKGSIPTPSPQVRPSSVISVKKTEHSVKPECVYTMIEAMYPGLAKVELFARNQRQGWISWGNQSHE